MSEEGYIKAPCHECHGRISLPQDAVGVDFNCPHCGVGLQMLLKHTCEHCGGRLSFDGTPEAIGMEIECGHCHNSTKLAPSTFAMDGAGASTEPAGEEEYEEEHEDEEEYEEEYEDEEEIPEPDTETRRRTGPPKPRPPKRAGPPKPRQPRKDPGGKRPGQKPEKISRSIAGTEPVEEDEPAAPRRRRPAPKRRAGPSGGAPRRMAGATQQLDEDPADPMSGDLPGPGPVAAPGPAGPPGVAPVQRKMAGGGAAEDSPAGAKPQPTFKSAARDEVEEEDGDEGPWYKNKEKKKLAIVSGVFLTVFLLVGLPGLGVYPSPISALFGSGYRTNRTDKIEFDNQSFKIETDAAVYYITGLVRNTSDETFEQVELKFILYDAQGNKLGETIDFTNKLGPSMEWRFRAVSMFTNVTRADLDEVVVR